MLPNIRQKWRAVNMGAIVVTALWLFAAWLFSSYVDSIRQVNLVYGGLGGVIIALVFFYVLSLMYIFGAELNYQLEKAMGHAIIEKEHVEENTVD